MQKNLGESKSFVDSIWKKLKQDSQYQLEEAYDWASYFKHLQSIFIEFDPAVIPTKSMMVRYFEEGLKPFIKAKMDQDATHLDDYEELVAKVVRAKAKPGILPSFYVWKTNIQVLQRSRPAHITTHNIQTYGVIYRREDAKASKTPASTSKSKPSHKARKDKKEK